MAKIEHIKKSRKDNTCSKCRKIIPKGSAYLKGVINFSPSIIRCESCGLQQWEVTTSEYQKEVGEVAFNWRDNFSIDESSVEEIKSTLETIRDNEQDKLDNLPENLQSSPNAELLQERIDALDSTIDELDCIDIDGLKADAVSSIIDDEHLSELDYDVILEKDDVDDDLKESLQQEYDSNLEEAIDEALNNLNI